MITTVQIHSATCLIPKQVNKPSLHNHDSGNNDVPRTPLLSAVTN